MIQIPHKTLIFQIIFQLLFFILSLNSLLNFMYSNKWVTIGCMVFLGVIAILGLVYYFVSKNPKVYYYNKKIGQMLNIVMFVYIGIYIASILYSSVFKDSIIDVVVYIIHGFLLLTAFFGLGVVTYMVVTRNKLKI